MSTPVSSEDETLSEIVTRLANRLLSAVKADPLLIARGEAAQNVAPAIEAVAGGIPPSDTAVLATA